ncbi:MAG: hypothetical protein IPH75_14885 [bacterium]|nr:hypothetical protein [bacterium]
MLQSRGSLENVFLGHSPPGMLASLSLVIDGGCTVIGCDVRHIHQGEGAKTVHLQAEMNLPRRFTIISFRKLHSTMSRRFWGVRQPSSEVGDMLDVMLMEKRVIVTVADVSGHGVRAGVRWR